MNQRLVIVILVAIIAGGIVFFWLRRPQEVEIERGTGEATNESIQDAVRKNPPETPAVTMTTRENDPKIMEIGDTADGIASIADLKLPLHFADKSLSKPVQEAIEVDLETVFSTMTTHRRDSLSIDGEKQEWITFEGGPDEVPAIVRKEFGAIEATQGKEYFLVSKELSEAYESALEFRNDHAEKFRALSDTIARIEKLDPTSKQSTLKVITPGREAANIQEHVVKLLSEADLKRPSVLNLGLDDYESNQVLTAKLYVSDSPDGSSTEIFFIFHEGEWAPVVGTPGT